MILLLHTKVRINWKINMVRYGMVRYGTVRYGMVWHGNYYCNNNKYWVAKLK